MLEILEFIFRDFWTFCGIVILLCIIGECVIGVTSSITCIFNKNSNNKESESDETN